MLKDFIKKLHEQASKQKALVLQSFFKTGAVEYGAGDEFIGVTVPQIRAVVKQAYANLSLPELAQILASKIHEERLFALLCLVAKFEDTQDLKQQKIMVDFYLKAATQKQINNWDLVDLSCYKILGSYLFASDKAATILYKFAQSKNMWERRISVVSTYAFIKNNDFFHTLNLVANLLSDNENLIHKACGWMLREVGKRHKKTLENFLEKYAGQMPRVMLSYALEKFTPAEKIYYRNKKG